MNEQDTGGVSRRAFVKMAAAGAGLAALPGGAALANDFEAARGSRVGWCRLRFPVRSIGFNDWYHHPYADLSLINLIRKSTNSNLEYKWNQADLAVLEQMTPYPFIFMHA